LSVTVCLAANTLFYPQGGGHLWAYLNWALGFKSLGCRVVWLEGAAPNRPAEQVRQHLELLRCRLKPHGLADGLALWKHDGAFSPDELHGALPVEAALEADLLVNQQYGMRADLVARFRRSALLDIDPGLTQLWLSRGLMTMAPHDFYFTIGETVGRAGARFPDNGLPWRYTPPCVSIEHWAEHAAPEEAPLTTVTHWSMGKWEEHEGELYANDKRTGFLPYLDLPGRTSQALELALLLGDWDQDERGLLESHGWRVSDSHAVASTPDDYQAYIQGSRGEFSCVKPSCVRLQNAWISDRSLCYLASGKPVVVEHTGPSRFLPDAEGLLRFRSMDEALDRIEELRSDYSRHAKAARRLAEEYFDARKVARRLLEQALD